MKAQMRLIAGVGIGTAVVAGVVTGVNFVNAHGGDATKVHACYKNLPPTYNGDIRTSTPQVNTNPSVRIIGANENCQAGEIALDWNTQGGLTGRETVTASSSVAGPTLRTVTASCPAGKLALGGGGGMIIGTGSLRSSTPNGDAAWTVAVDATSAGSLEAYVICGVVNS